MSMILDGSNGVTFNDASLQGAAAYQAQQEANRLGAA
jgi:hypothetical protein